MNWGSIATSTATPPFLYLPSRHRPELPRPEAFQDSSDSNDSLTDEPKFEDKMDEHKMEDSDASDGHYPDTHLGRMASIFSDRMPCTGMYGPTTSMPQDNGSFSMGDMDSTSVGGSGGGSTVDGDLTMMTLDGGGPSTASIAGSYMLQPSLDMQPFDEQTSVDLQQLFPSTHGPASQSEAATGRHCYHAYPMSQGVPSAASSSLPSERSLGDQFSEPYESLPSAHSDHTVAAHMMVPFPFGAGACAHSAFDEPDDLATPLPGGDAPTAAMEMQDVSNLFHHAPLMTPPTAITVPRTTIVSPLNGFGPPRMLLPPTLRDFHLPLGKSAVDSLANAFDGDDGDHDDPHAKFSPDRRKLCCVDDCKSQARAFNRCKRHGGSKRCSAPNCTKSVQSRGLCIRHGGGSRCQESGCTRAAQSHGKCKMHGGGRPCVVPGCEKKAHLKRLCRKHGGGAKCSLPECEKWAQRQGMCMTHSKHQLTLLASPPPSPASSSGTSASPPPSAAMNRPARAFLHAHESAI